MPATEALAAASDIAKVWRPLTAAEATRADGLIESVSRAVRREWPDVDARIAAGTLDPASVTDVIVWSVLPILMPGVDVPANVRTYQQSSGSKSVSVTLDGPAAGSWMTFASWMVEVFAPRAFSGMPRSRFRAPAGGLFDSLGFLHNDEPRRRGARDASRD